MTPIKVWAQVQSCKALSLQGAVTGPEFPFQRVAPASASPFTPCLAQRKHLWKEGQFIRSFPSSKELYSHFLSPSLCLPSSALLLCTP